MPEETTPRDMVRISHPDIDSIGGPVTRKALDEVWAPRGWTEVDPLVAAANEAIGGEVPANLNSLTKEKLIEVAESLGVPVDPSDTKSDIIAKLEASVVT